MRYEFEDSIGYWIAIANQGFARAITEKLAPHGITYRQAQVLGYLELDGPQTQKALCGRMLIEPPSLVGVLNRMELAGLVERRGCPDDRRRKLIYPLPPAEAIWEKVAGCAREVRAQAAKGLSTSEVAQLKTLLQKVHQNVSSTSPTAA
ncbi:Transcriptional regulator SlyA [Pirellulimonas nuda]|uniref:Transcriptional regulator SlyA n=1 Tax=Pirellulimonas nuda TaxID=2528009 RepID=A0A518D614_9BACT|nr:MarR family winged helix-turn-helix transcriptional regulator [Pirellulimonas nuda]QDU86913.1 Transcriptional regulator SlyA [Pirellulimonas nuda]